MNPVTHLLISWTFSESMTADRNSCRAVAWAGVLPDADGLGLLVDLVYDVSGKPVLNLYSEYHHLLFHGLFGAVVISLMMAAWARKPIVFLLSFVCVHIHLLCDLIGSRGPNPDDIWMIHYLEPFSQHLTFSWSKQWELNGWQNILISILLLLFVFAYAVKKNRSVIRIFSEKYDNMFVDVVKKWLS